MRARRLERSRAALRRARRLMSEILHNSDETVIRRVVNGGFRDHPVNRLPVEYRADVSMVEALEEHSTGGDFVYRRRKGKPYRR